MSAKRCPEILMENQPEKGEWYVMECSIEAERHELSGAFESTRRVKWDGYATASVVDKMLEAVAKVVDE